MATLRQKKLAQAIVDNSVVDKPLNKKELVVSSGYAEMSAESSAHTIIEQKGVQEELERLGFTEDGAKSVVVDIMYNEEIEPNARLKASDQMFKVLGSYAPEKSVNLNVGMLLDSPEKRQLAKEYEERLKALL